MQYSVTRLGISVLGLLGQAGVTTAAPPKHPPMRGTNDTNEAETPWEPDHDRWSSHSFQCSNLTYARLDPLIFPGEVSPHLHLVFGGSGFGPKLRSELSRCTSCEIVDDASIYWVPSLFVQIDGGVQPIPTDEIKVYYQMRPMKGEDVMAFPPGFKAIAGNTLKRHFSDDLAGDAVTYACLGSNHNETNEFPPYNCPDGLRTQIYFPSCWNGEDDPINHSDHLAYPVHKNDAGHCPSSHPKKLPGLFIEVKYPTQKFAHLWNGDQHPFVLSNGDKTGYSFHSDFVNGWAPGAMEKLIACGPNQGDTSALSCPTLKTQGFYDREDCRLPKVVPEDVFTHSPELPGCNPIRADEQDIPVSEYRNCNKKPPLGPPFQEYTDVTQTLGWRYLGCAEDHLEHRSIGSWKWEPPSNNMTVQYCIQHCEECNQTVAGLQYGSECFCGTEQRMQGPTEGILRKCNIPCRGNSSQFCGGGVRNSVYVKCGGGPCRNVDFKLEVDY